MLKTLYKTKKSDKFALCFYKFACCIMSVEIFINLL